MDADDSGKQLQFDFSSHTAHDPRLFFRGRFSRNYKLSRSSSLSMPVSRRTFKTVRLLPQLHKNKPIAQQKTHSALKKLGCLYLFFFFIFSLYYNLSAYQQAQLLLKQVRSISREPPSIAYSALVEHPIFNKKRDTIK